MNAALIKAAETGDIVAVNRLLETGAHPDATSKFGSALFSAARNGHVSMIDLLVKAGADPNAMAKHYDGITALGSAAMSGDVSIVEALLKAGADPNFTDGDGETALKHAAYNGKASVIEPLVKGGADPNAKDKQGYTPLMWAVAEGKASVIEPLVKGGADPNARYENGYPLLKRAANHYNDQGRVSLIEALLNVGADPTKAIFPEGKSVNSILKEAKEKTESRLKKEQLEKENKEAEKDVLRLNDSARTELENRPCPGNSKSLSLNQLCHIFYFDDEKKRDLAFKLTIGRSHTSHLERRNKKNSMFRKYWIVTNGIFLPNLLESNGCAWSEMESPQYYAALEGSEEC